MDELDNRSQIVVVPAAITQRAGRQQDERRTQALAAAADDVLGDLTDKHDLGMQPVADHRVHGLHIGPDQGIKLFLRHIEPAIG